jgi:hypothetical protein
MPLNREQKMMYIKRRVGMLTEDMNKKIYQLIRRNVGEKPIRNTKSRDGVCIDLNAIEDDTIIDAIYILVEKRESGISISDS